jgi:hypothetical protein
MEFHKLNGHRKQTPRTFPKAVNLRREYGRVMELRDLYWIRQMILQDQFHLSSHLNQFPALECLLDHLRLMVRSCEESAIYIKDWAKSKAKWNVDFDLIEEQRRRSLPVTHSSRLIQPYLVRED